MRLVVNNRSLIGVCHDCATIEPGDIVEIYREGRERFPSGLIRTMCGHNAERHPARHWLHKSIIAGRICKMRARAQ
jgi:hypothetical protein